jgi:mono/diheme cytochrome c family protein
MMACAVRGPAYAAEGRSGEVSPLLAQSSCASGGGCRGAKVLRNLAVVALVSWVGVEVNAQAPVSAKPPAGNADNGRRLYEKMTCSYCHGSEGQGSIAGVGPRVALVQRSFDSFARYVRQPGGRMTGYSDKILSDAELTDIYAFLRSLPAAKPVSEIPLLQQLRKR